MESETAVENYINPSYINKFVTLINDGINSWCLAGEMLVKMHKQEPNVLKMINAQHSYLSMETLEIFFNIGLKVIHPHVALLPRRFVVPISKLTYTAQENVLKQPVKVVSHLLDNNDPVIRNKPLSKLSAQELKYAIDRRGNVSVDKQIDYLKSLRPVIKTNHKPTNHKMPKSLGLFMIKRGSKTEWELVKTGERKYNTQTIIIEDGKATIELKQYDNE